MDQNAAANLVISMMHLTGIAKMLVSLVLGGGIVGGFLLKGVKPIQDARNVINTMTVLIADMRKNLVNDKDKQDFNAAIDSIMTTMSDLKILKDKIPMLQQLKINVDTLTPAPAPAPLTITTESKPGAPAQVIPVPPSLAEAVQQAVKAAQ